MPIDEISADWLTTLRADGPVRDDAHARLHELLLRIARGEAHRRSPQLRVSGAELDDLAHRQQDPCVRRQPARPGQLLDRW